MTREKKFTEVMQKLDAQVRFELRQGNHSQVAELRQAIAKLEGWHNNNFIPEICPVNLESFKLQGWNVVEELPVPNNGDGNICLVTKMLREAEGEENLTKALDQATQLINMGIDDPDMQRAVLIAEERLQSLQTLPVHPDEEVSGEENKLTGTIVDEKNQPAEKTSAASVLAQVESIDELLKKAGIALAADKFDDAMELCQKVKDQSPDHPDALELAKVAASRKFRYMEDQRLKRLENTLNTSQEMDLEDAIRDVEALQAEGKATPELLEALRKARPRFEDFRHNRILRMKAAEAMWPYEDVGLTIKMLEEDLGLGVETWPDDRVGGEPRPVVDLLYEFRQLQAKKVKESFNRFMAKAKDEKRIHPKQAQLLLKEALSLENLDIEWKRQAEKELEEIAEAVRIWQEAEDKQTGTTVDEKNQPAEKTSAASAQAQVESIDELLKKAGIALAADKFDEAMELCRRVKDQSPDHPDALELAKVAASRKFRYMEGQRLKRLENTLNTSQEMDVEYAIRDVEALQAEGKATPELLEALRKARPRFEDIRKGRQIRTTAEAMGDYEGVCLTIKMLDKDLGLGVETWPDDRQKEKPRPVVDLLGEFRQLQAVKVKEPFDRFMGEAKNKKRIHPKQAQELLNKALSLENLDIERKRQVEKELEEIKEAVRKWQEAEDAINEAKITALYDPRQACGHLARARNIYPDHADIDYVGGYLADLIASDNIPKIYRQIAESKRYQSQGLFEKALKVLDEIPSIPVGLPEHDGLKAAQAELKITVTMVENARQTAEIAEKAAEAISRELRSGKLEAALAIFKRQDEKVQQTARLQDIYSEMLAASGDTEGLVRQAKEAVENQQWQAACNILKKASEEGNYGRSQVRPLRIAAEIGLRKEEISRWLTERRYDRVQNSLNALLSVQGLEGSQKETLEKEYADLIVEIKNRGKNDPEVRRLLGNARVIYQDNRLGDQRFVDTYEILLKAEMAESCLVGEVMAFKVEVYEGLCQSLSARLARSAKVVKAAKSQDAGDGIKILEQIKKYQMVCSEEDNQNRKIILNAHYLTQERVHQEHGRWENIIALWKEALGKFPNEVEFYQKLKSAQRNWLIQRINTALNESKFGDAGRLLTRENSYGLSDENAQRFDVSSDSELNSLNDATIILTEAQRLFEDQKYGAMVSYLERQIGSVPPPLPVIGIYLYKHRQTAATLLIQKGDSLMRNGQAPEAVIQFSEAVSVSPTDPSARARIAANLGQVREEVILRISKGYDCNVERYSNWVDDQLEEDRKLLESLDNLTAVLPYLGAEEEDFRRRLGLAAAKVKRYDPKIAGLR